MTFHRLLAEHGSAGEALAALPAIARAAGVGDYQPCPPGVAAAELAAGSKAGARLLFLGDPFYPAALAGLPDAPPFLWLQGDAGLLMRPMVALVGARNASSLGVRMARSLARGIGQAGFAVVSGLARGVDSEAHMAAMATGTIAVQAGGVDVIYPGENAALAEEIRQHGLRLSEHPPGTQPQARHFPLRNRIVAGLSQAVVVVEAAARSGSLITARLALDQGREVLAVPGHPFDARAAGCNMLIRDGAALVRDTGDVLEALGQAAPVSSDTGELATAPTPRPMPKPAPQPVAPPEPEAAKPAAARPPRPAPDLSGVTRLHNMILDRLGPSPLPEDQLIRDLSLPPASLAPELLTLELEGRILRQPGGLLSRL
ncbi:hypothetical protein XINFAN_03368 [Pseudogemmobacter humi]|uniref:Uncharacterized protein n=1 Tax=Pseudogemmobacter humi TaxID=2483812 RepID=A0A3P5XVX8_9RHOB|nr:hypothetical protein XINFAN_03368 [Pseudogemmobacter humi]